MKILVIAPRFHTNLYFRVKALIEGGHEVKVAVLYKGKSEYYKDIELIQFQLSIFSKWMSRIIQIFKKKNLKTNLELRFETPNKELNHLLKTFKPDVVLLKAFQNLLAVSSIWRARRNNAKIIQLVQTNKPTLAGSKILLKLNLKICYLMGVSAYLTPVKWTKDIFEQLNINHVYYLPFVFPAVELPISYEYPEINLLSIGKIVPRKAHLLLLKAVKILHNENYPITLSIFGEPSNKDYLSKMQQFISANAMQTYVFIGFEADYEKILAQYSKHHLFVLPSSDEPAAYSPVEAMAHGLPVICSTENGTKCYIKEGVNGFIFEDGNLENLVEKIEKAISKPEYLKKLAVEAKKSAQKNHLPEDFSRNLIHIISNLQ
jgi:glycosyltransferase involved in cell wall biosynthesis